MKVSLITVCYNSVKTIGHTIETVLNQDYKNIEYIVNKLELKSIEANIKFPFETKSNYNSIRFMPHVSKTQGFFVSVFRKK